jgi:hypothetical protein
MEKVLQTVFQTINIMTRNLLTYQLVLNVSFDPQGTTPSELEHNLHQVVKDAVNNGTLTGETPATVEHYDYSVKQKAAKPSPKNPWPTWVVHYWSHDPRINDCVGNLTAWTGKARTEKEASHRARYGHRRKYGFGGIPGRPPLWFRLHSVTKQLTFSVKPTQ